MKMLPVQLSLNPPLGLWSDVLWRHPPSIPSPLVDLKTQLPPQLPPDPRLWCREDVSIFLRFCEREFDLPTFEYDLFQMNGKALCLLNRTDFGERCPGAGDVLHNVLQMLIRESQMMHRHLPSSPVTPTSRYPLSPHSHPPTPTWPSFVPPDSPFHNAHLHHFMPPNSVTLSPAPSIDSQTSSPPQNQEQNGNVSGFNQNHTTSSSSNQSDSDEDNYADSKNAAKAAVAAVAAAAAAAAANYNTSPPSTPALKDIKVKPTLSQQITNNLVNSWSQSQQNNQKIHFNSGNVSSNGSVSAPTTPNAYMPVKREFFPENGEPNTNGRLLWDFLQQLLNDRNQQYSHLIAWKCRDTGVFKIVDPAGLAKLWGIQKNHLSMNYDKMSRALRYYYRVNILRKVQGERHCYQFLRNPTELKNIKNISLLRQSVTSSSSGSSNTTDNGSSTNNGITSSSSSTQNTQQTQQQQQHHQSSLLTSQSQNSPQLPQRPSSNGNNQFGSPINLPQIQVPSSISSSAAAAVAAAAAAYGPPPTSPLFMHAINGAFHYLSTNSQPPHSPVLPPTPSEKLQFSNLRIESSPHDIDEMKPTDLSVGGSERKSYGQNNDNCYPLIRNADGLTTIKLIRYNENESTQMQQQSSSPVPHGNPMADRHSPNNDMASSSMDNENTDINVDDSLMPTDLRK